MPANIVNGKIIEDITIVFICNQNSIHNDLQIYFKCQFKILKLTYKKVLK